jgi:tetratricopeptide (TPR) repeat protein
MWKPFNNIALLLASTMLLAACATAPGPDEQQVGRKTAEVPDKAKATYDRAIWSAKAGRDAEATALFAELTQTYPDMTLAFTNLGLQYLKAGKLPEAEQALQQAVTLDPGNAVALNHLGVALREQGKFQPALQAYQSALQTRPAYAAAHLNLGILYDLYIQNLPLALQQYETYQNLTGSSDKQVANWIIDIKQRMAAQARKGGQQG